MHAPTSCVKVEKSSQVSILHYYATCCVVADDVTNSIHDRRLAS